MNYPNVTNIPAEQRRVLDLLGSEPLGVDAILADTGYTAPVAIGILTLLEMRGLCRRVPGNAFVVTKETQEDFALTP